jgi:TetR/AcrR family transcriptional repressor of nem operon
MPRTSDADKRLMEAAMELIWENSYGATSVDDICRKAGVKKGSFYHFFASKSELAVAALEADWQRKKPTFDRIFSPESAPLERLADYFDHVSERQCAVSSACGSVLGCPLFILGSEVSTQDKAITAKVHEVLERHVRYFESAIRDAHAQGLIRAPRAKNKARLIFALYQGMLTQARIANDTTLLNELKPAVLELLGGPTWTEGTA